MRISEWWWLKDSQPERGQQKCTTSISSACLFSVNIPQTGAGLTNVYTVTALIWKTQNRGGKEVGQDGKTWGTPSELKVYKVQHKV